MRVDRVTVHPYALGLAAADLRFVEPVVWGGVPHTERRGALVRVETAAGAVGWGDAAPLPGFSAETLAEAVGAVASAVDGLTADEWGGADALRPDSRLHAVLDAAGLPPSARFALDLALADAAAQEAGRTLPQALAPDPAVLLPLAGLVLGGDGALAEAVRLAEAGYRTLKLKVGRASVEADAALVRAVRDAIGSGVALRLDANRAWSPGEARRFASAVDGVALDFVEEPLADSAGLPELWLDTGLPLALDETLHRPGSPGGGADALGGWLAAAVLKPTLVGGVAATLRLAARAEAVGVRPVLSSAFESGVGLRGLVALAAATGGHTAGLDTARWLASDVLATPLPLGRPTVDVPGLFTRAVEVVL